MPIGNFHKILVDWFIEVGEQFYSTIAVNDDALPEIPSGSNIVLASHSNGSMDPLILSGFFPHRRRFHYWVKSTLFKNKYLACILRAAGNIPVDRIGGDNEKLFAGTFEALNMGDDIAIFPEGGSFYSSKINPLKAGASWTILQYAKSLDTESGNTDPNNTDVTKKFNVLIVGINYSDKQHFRSNAVLTIGRKFDISSNVKQFRTEDPKIAVKNLTNDLQNALLDVTVNAPSFDVLYAAQMCRDILWPNPHEFPHRDMRDIDQALIDIFSTVSEPILTEGLVAYRLKLMPALFYSEHHIVRLFQGMERELIQLLGVAAALTFVSLVTLPFFILPILLFAPIYVTGFIVARKTKDPNDSAMFCTFSTFPLIIVYAPLVIMLLATVILPRLLPLRSPLILRGVVSVVIFLALSQYHKWTVDTYYTLYRRLYLAWRLVVENILLHANMIDKKKVKGVNTVELSQMLEKRCAELLKEKRKILADGHVLQYYNPPLLQANRTSS